jgi:hypothetical protein
VNILDGFGRMPPNVDLVIIEEATLGLGGGECIDFITSFSNPEIATRCCCCFRAWQRVFASDSRHSVVPKRSIVDDTAGPVMCTTPSHFTAR